MALIIVMLVPIALLAILVFVLILLDTMRRRETLNTINVQKAGIAARKRGHSDNLD